MHTHQPGFSRRTFLTTLAAATGGILVGRSAWAAPASSSALPLVTLGRTGIRTTLLGMGTGFRGFGGSSNIVRAGNAEALIRHAYDRGIRFFDCADAYGTHPFTAAALKGCAREQYCLSTKIWLRGGSPDPDAANAFKVVDRFRRELATDHLDLVQIHCMSDGTWTDQHKRTMDQLETLKARKVIRAHGVSVHSLEAMTACVEHPWVDVVHVRINPFGEAMDHKDPALVAGIIAKLHKAGKGVIGMKLVGNGAFRNDTKKVDESLRYVLGLGTVDMVLVGFEQPEQIDNYLERIRAARAARK